MQTESKVTAVSMPSLRGSTTAAVELTRTRPAFEKLLIGPAMIFGEAITGGHYMDVLRFGKQMVAGRHYTPSYWTLHKSFVSETGFVGAFYRGFLPWGLLQCVKGVPVLFVQSESMYQLQARAGFSPNTAEKCSGFLGGAAQAVFVTPLQKVMVNVIASPSMNSISPWQAWRTVVRTEGVLSLFDGLTAMMLRRSLDWGIRWSVSSEMKNYMLSHKSTNTDSLHIYEMLCCGVVGGVASALTHPIDNVITNSQKPLPPGATRDFTSVACRMYRESGVKAFTRGMAIKVIDSGYHMAWMYAIGGLVYEYIRRHSEC